MDKIANELKDGKHVSHSAISKAINGACNDRSWVRPFREGVRYPHVLLFIL